METGTESGEDGNSVLVVGGGIAGLFCAKKLGEARRAVRVLEATARFGGRIETADLKPGPRPGGDPFKAEFGPMRFELDLQRELKGLLDGYGIHYGDFPAPSPAMPPVTYPLADDETSRSGLAPSSLELLKLGVYRLFGHNPRLTEELDKEGNLRAKVRLSPAGQRWLDELSDQDGGFDRLRQTALMPGTNRPLHDLGFWNALYSVLSPMAVAYVFQFGTFYHLMPDNPNAVEWAIFWVRLFQLGDKDLSTIPTGVSTLVTKILDDLRQMPTVELLLNVAATSVSPTEGGMARVDAFDATTGRSRDFNSRHVMFALPQQPLMKLSAEFEEPVKDVLSSVIAFPLLKVFCITATPPWWRTQPRRPQQGAWLLPTREVHYFPRLTAEDNTMILLYTDRPGTVYWQTYVVNSNSHQQAEINQNEELKRALATILFNLHFAWAKEQLRPRDTKASFSINDPSGSQVLEALAEIGRTTLKREENREDVWEQLTRQHPAVVGYSAEILFSSDNVKKLQLELIGDYAIRDWSREPFGAGCHAWAPGAKSWEVRSRLRAFGFRGHEDDQNLHICGEAFSDYQGFIEGALRSAKDALASMGV